MGENVSTPPAPEQMGSKEQQPEAARQETQVVTTLVGATLNELEVLTEDELPREEESQGEIRTGTLVANTFRQLTGVAVRYDRYDKRNKDDNSDNEGSPISARVKPPTKPPTKEKAPNRKDKSPAFKK